MFDLVKTGLAIYGAVLLSRKAKKFFSAEDIAQRVFKGGEKSSKPKKTKRTRRAKKAQ